MYFAQVFEMIESRLGPESISPLSRRWRRRIRGSKRRRKEDAGERKSVTEKGGREK